MCEHLIIGPEVTAKIHQGIFDDEVKKVLNSLDFPTENVQAALRGCCLKCGKPIY